MFSRGRCPTVGGGEVCIFCCFQYFVKNRKSKVSLVKRDNRAMQLYRFFFYCIWGEGMLCDAACDLKHTKSSGTCTAFKKVYM